MTDENTEWSDLSSNAQKVIAEKKVESSARIANWLESLEELADFDEIVEKRQSKALGKTWLLYIALILIGSVSLCLVNDPGKLKWFFLLPLLTAALVAAVMSNREYLKFKRMNLDDSFRKLLIPVLRALREDVAPKGMLKLKLDASNSVHEAHRVHEREIPSKWRKLIETLYVHPWCELSAPLVNGGTLTLSIVNNLTSYERHYSNKSGTKSKIKMKWKILTTVTTAILPAPNTFSWDQTQVQSLAAKEKVKLKDKGEAQVCRLVRRFKGKGTESDIDTAKPDEIIAMFMQLSSMLSAPTTGGE